MPEVLDTIQRATALLADVARADLSALDDAQLLSVLGTAESACRLLDALRVLAAGEVAERSRYEPGADGLSMRLSYRKPIDFIEFVTRTSKAEAGRRVRIGQAVRARQSILGETLPPARSAVAEALRSGELGIDAANNIIGFLKQAASGSEATPENMDAAEMALVGLAAHDAADDVADIARAWRDALDPDGVEPRHDDIQSRQGVFIGPQRNGIKTYTIKAAPVLSAELDAVFQDSMDPKALPRFLSAEDIVRGTTFVEGENGELVETLTDPRSIEQKRVDILKGVLIAGTRATRGGPVDLRTDRLCDRSHPAERPAERHGLRQRSFTTAQRRAIVARDGDRCIAKGCRKRAAGCHAHHVVFFASGGLTDVDNGVMLCPAHHHALHQGTFEIRMIDGRPWIRDSIDFLDDGAWQPAGRNRLLLGVPA